MSKRSTTNALTTGDRFDFDKRVVSVLPVFRSPDQFLRGRRGNEQGMWALSTGDKPGRPMPQLPELMSASAIQGHLDMVATFSPISAHDGEPIRPHRILERRIL